MQSFNLARAVQVLLLFVLIVVIFYYGKPFLVPLTFAAILAMLLLQVTRWLERKRVNKVLAVLLSLLIFIAFLAGIVALISWQVADLAKDAPQIEKNLNEKVQQVKTFVAQSLGISEEKQNQVMKEQQNSSSGQLKTSIAGLLAGVGGFLTNLLIVLVYTFLFLYFRSHLHQFILRLVPKAEQGRAETIVQKSTTVARKYLTGLALMIVCLWVMYGIGFTIVGVKNAIFFAILCGLLEIVPFVGNLAGNLITILMVVAQGGDMAMIIGILITYALVQFIQTYILEPLVVGAEVSINPVFTIIGIVAGEMLWGIPGMILAIPILGITKIICDHIEPLKPYGYLIGEERKPRKGQKKS